MVNHCYGLRILGVKKEGLDELDDVSKTSDPADDQNDKLDAIRRPLTSIETCSEPCSSESSFCQDRKPVIVRNTARDPEVLPSNICPRFCSVCGEAATGYHYSVPSCNGCKTFFRRTIVQGKHYTCKAGGQCASSAEKRRFCRACRYESCVKAGMDPLLIQFSEKVEHQDVMKQVLRKRFPQNGLESMLRSKRLMNKFQVRISSVRLAKDETFQTINDLLELELKLEFLRLSTFAPEDDNMSLTALLNSPLVDRSKYKSVKTWKLEQPEQVEFLGAASKTARVMGAKEWFFCDMTLAVEYAKTLPFFQGLSFSDKFVLAKATAAMQCALTQSFYSYDKKSNTLLHPDGVMPILFAKSPTPLECCIFNKGVETMIRCQPDNIEYVLLKAITTTNNSFEGLSEKGKRILERERQKYASYLLSYMKVKYGAQKGPTRFADLVCMIDAYAHIASRNKEYHWLLCALTYAVTSVDTQKALLGDVLG